MSIKRKLALILAQEIVAIDEHQIAERAIQAITGKIPQQLAPVKADIKTNSLMQGMDQWIDIAAKNDVNIQIELDTLKLSEQEIERAKAGYLPTLDAVASYNNHYANVGYTGFGNDPKLDVVGLQLQILLYQGGAISSRVRQAALNQQKEQDDIKIARRDTELATQRAYLNLSTSIAQVKAYEQALISSQSQVDSTKLGYEVSVRTGVDVLNTQPQLFSAMRICCNLALVIK